MSNPYMPTNFKKYCGEHARIRTVDVHNYELLYPLIEREALFNNLRAAEWALGYVPSVHNLFLSSGIGTSCIDIVTDKIVPAKMKISGKSPEIDLINKEFEATLTSSCKRIVKQSAMYGSSLARICFGGLNYTKPFIDSVPLGRFRCQVDEAGKVLESTCFLETKKTEENSYARYILTDKRYFNSKGEPCAYYGVIKLTFNTVMSANEGDFKTIEFRKDNLDKNTLESLQAIFPNNKLYKESILPFDNYLGVEMVNWTEDNSKFPSVVFGEAFLVNVGDELYAYDHAFTSKENDKYLGRGRVIVPNVFKNDSSYADERPILTSMQQGTSMLSTPYKPGAYRRTQLDQTFYDAIPSLNGENLKPENVQFNLRTAEWRMELDGILGDIASRLHISAVDLDTRMNQGTQRTATEVNKDSDNSLNLVEVKRTLITPHLNALIRAYLKLKGLNYKVVDCFVEWPKNGLGNPQVATEVIASQVMNGFLSKKTAIARLNPNWSDEEVEEELKRISQEEVFKVDEPEADDNVN